MRYLLLFMALALSCGAGWFMGCALSARVMSVRNRSSGSNGFAPQVLEDPVLLFVVLAALSCIVGTALEFWLVPPCLVASALLARKGPAFLAKRKAQALRGACDKHLDVLCDIVAMGVEAGLSFDAALELYCQRFNNELSRGMSLARKQWLHGIVPRSVALQGLAQEVGSLSLKRFADTVTHGIAHGAPLADLLKQLGADLRRVRKMSVQRQVEKASVKMLIPTSVCILPAMLLVVMGPMLLQFLGT